MSQFLKEFKTSFIPPHPLPPSCIGNPPASPPAPSLARPESAPLISGRDRHIAHDRQVFAGDAKTDDATLGPLIDCQHFLPGRWSCCVSALKIFFLQKLMYRKGACQKLLFVH